MTNGNPLGDTYGFGPREGKLINQLYQRFVKFAEEFDISFAELLGLIIITQTLMTEDMVVVEDPDEESDPSVENGA